MVHVGQVVKCCDQNPGIGIVTRIQTASPFGTAFVALAEQVKLSKKLLIGPQPMFWVRQTYYREDYPVPETHIRRQTLVDHR